MRLSPLALALAFGTAKVVAAIVYYAATIFTSWSTNIRYGISPPWWRPDPAFNLQFILVHLVLFGFVAGAIAGALAAVVYNKVVSSRPAPILANEGAIGRLR